MVSFTTIPCEKCGEQIAADVEVCQHCGAERDIKNYHYQVVGLAVVMFVVLMFLFMK
jgi:uncharacterized OB-fold protein